MTSFLERQKKLYNHLKDAEEQCNFSSSARHTSQPDYGIIDKKTYKKVKQEMKQFRDQESIFAQEENNIHQCLIPKLLPDFIKNPGKWQYYSLLDVTPEQMSDKTNTQTALALMREMEAREIDNDNNEVTDETGAVFKKPAFKVSKTIKEIKEEEQQPVIKRNKIIMPEYVVGVTGRKRKTKRNIIKPDNITNTIKKAQLKLNHLYEVEDEETM